MLPPFPGFTDAGLQFLRYLKAHNDREWFTPRKAQFEDEVLDPARLLVADFSREASHRGLPLSGDPKRSIFRIYRDTRFSKDKRPYKTHVGMVLSRTGGRGEEGVVYVHVEPGESFIGSGFWQPETPLLRRFRERMASDPEGWLGVVEEVSEAGLSIEPEDTLKRMPRGYESHAESPVAPWLKARSLLVTRPVADGELREPSFTETVLDVAEATLPFLAYGWALMDGPR
jgi:uncharacterized protein (TIGR02453 family)